MKLRKPTGMCIEGGNPHPSTHKLLIEYPVEALQAAEKIAPELAKAYKNQFGQLGEQGEYCLQHGQEILAELETHTPPFKPTRALLEKIGQ